MANVGLGLGVAEGGDFRVGEDGVGDKPSGMADVFIDIEVSVEEGGVVSGGLSDMGGPMTSPIA